jgi:hypothetical protein
MAYENGKLVLIGGEALRKTLRELAKRSVKYYDNVTLNKQQWFEIYADIFGAIKDEIKRQMDWDIYIEPAHAEPTTNLHETIIEQVYKEGPRSCMSNNISNVLNTFYAHSSKEKGNVFIVYAVNSSDTIVARGLAFITDDEKVVVLNDTYAQVNNNIFRKLAMNKLKEYFVDADAVVSVHTFNEDYEKTISVKVAPNPGCCGEYIVPYIDGFARIEEASSCLVLGGSKELIYDTEAYTDTDSHGLTALYGSKDFDVITINGDYVSANYATWEPQADGTWGWEEECD